MKKNKKNILKLQSNEILLLVMFISSYFYVGIYNL